MEAFVDYMLTHPPNSVYEETLWNYEGYGIPASRVTIDFYNALTRLDIEDSPASLRDLRLPIPEMFKCPMEELPIMRYDQDSLMKFLFGLSVMLQYDSPEFSENDFLSAVRLALMRLKILVTYPHSLDVLNMLKYRHIEECETGEVYASCNMLFLVHAESMFRDFFEAIRISQELVNKGPVATTEPKHNLEIADKTLELNYLGLRISNGVRRCYFTEFLVIKKVTSKQFVSYLHVSLDKFPEQFLTARESQYLNAKYSDFLEMGNIAFCAFRKAWIYKPEMLAFDTLLSLYVFLNTK